MKLILPRKFRTKILTKTNISGALDTLVDTFSDWLTRNQTDFFPEYTDHGIDHIQSVLNTAEEIIPDMSWDIISPEDIYVLTVSILLHDCAMHISKEGLWELINNDLYNGVLLGFENEEEWSNRWSKFTSEVKRFDEQDYSIFFGEFRDVSLPEIGCNSLEDNQKILIGDFVRKYHACIAQVISTYGIPGPNGPLNIFDSNFNYLNQLSGLIARSHNHGLRSVVDLLGDDRKREHRNTHPAYLMGILRIADYLQLKSDRTPKILFNSIGFCSPISIREWKKHLSIISTNAFHPDDELLFIEAFPEDASTLVGVKHLLSGLQKELDEFWAVTGEVYSRYSPLNKLALNYRRVKSNIDNPTQYVERNHKTYHPEVLAVKTDNQKLFPLLIKPLYGDLPQVGLRELLQNSLDATNERYGQVIDGNVNKSEIPFEINIVIDLDKNTLTLKDEGVGMNVEIIKDYFLKVGSSYRTSEEWKSKYSSGKTSKIPRTGKFGIGMLAGFLIGDNIEVYTRNLEVDSKSIHFSYKLDSNEIELKFKNKIEIGTSIIIHSDQERLNTIIEGLDYIYEKDEYHYGLIEEERISSWWYFLDTPKVKIQIIENEQSKSIKPEYIINKDDLFKSWNKIEDSELDGFYWRLNKNRKNIYCNGIMLQKMVTPNINIISFVNNINIDDIEIFLVDNIGKFPLNLTRDELVTSYFPEIEKLQKSVKSNFMDRFNSQVSNYTYDKEMILSTHDSYSYGWKMELIPQVFTENKTMPFSGKDHEKISNYIFVDFIYKTQSRGLIYHPNFNSLKNEFSYSYFKNAEKKADTIEKAINLLLLANKDSYGWNSYGQEEPTKQNLSTWLYIKDFDFKKLQEHDSNSLSELGLTILQLTDWVVITNTKKPQEPKVIAEKILKLNEGNFFIFALYKKIKLEPSEFSQLWEEKYKEEV